MKIKTIFEKIKGLFKTKTAVRVIAVSAAIIAVGAVILCAVLISGGGKDKSDTFTVVFVSNGGGSVAGLKVGRGDKIPRPADPEKEGYIFGGWYVHGLPWNFDINTARDNIVMSAVWLEAVSVTFDTGDGTHTVSAVKNSPMREVDIPEIQREDFYGWFIGSEKWNFSEPVTENLYLVAGYKSELGASGDIFNPLDELYGATGITLTSKLSGELKLGAVNTETEGLLNLLDYLEYMPNFSAFLDENPQIYEYLSALGGVYYAPKPIKSGEYSFYMNSEWVKLLLDSEINTDGSQRLSNMYYKPYISDALPIVSVLSSNDYIIKNLEAAGNIIYTMNLYNSDADFCGAEALSCLIGYISTAYSAYYSNVPSRVFLGDSAVYDTDELAALLRIALSNPQVPGENIAGIYVDKNDRTALLSLIASLFGIDDIRIYTEKIYFSGELLNYDGSGSEIEAALDAFNQMIKEGLVTFSDKENALVRYGGSDCADDGYTEVLSPASQRIESGETWEYVRITDTAPCDIEHSISVIASELSDTEELLAALRVVDYMYK